LRIFGLYYDQNCPEYSGSPDYRWICVPYEFRNTGYSHLPILHTPNRISHHCTKCCCLWGTNWMYCRCTHPSSWEIGALITICGFISKVPDAFKRMALLNSSESLEGILKGKGASKVYSNILSRFTICIYDNPVETEVALLFRNLSAWVIMRYQPRQFWQDRRRELCDAVSFAM